jgi:hypothetical protein
MPVIHIHHHTSPADIPRILRRVCSEGSLAVGVAIERVWALWHDTPRAFVCRPDWESDSTAGPIVRVFCRRSHAGPRVHALMLALRNSLSAELGCPASSVFVHVVRVDDEDVINVG